mgnify:CR=1 FL=1
MFDLLSLLQGRGEKTLSGSYYPKTPLSANMVSQPFDYEIIDGNSRRYQMITGNLKVDANACVISTKDDLEWKTNANVVLQNGKMYVIESIREDLQDVDKNSYRLHSNSYDMEYVLSLIEIDNVWGLK